MKKITLLLLVVMALTLAACTNDSATETTETTEATLTDEEKVAEDIAAISITDDYLNVKNDLDLPTQGAHGSEITWVSNNTPVIANDGTVTRPGVNAGDEIVRLTATIKLNDVTEKRVYSVVVIDTDTQMPEINGAKDLVVESYTTEKEDSFWLEGVTATDLQDGDITSNIEVHTRYVKNDETGTYSLKYSVKDSDGNETTVFVDIEIFVVPNEVVNGGFETGDLTGWTASGDVFSADYVYDDDAYWEDGKFFGKDGDYFYRGNDAEASTGTIHSSIFKINGSGWISYKLGGGKPNRDVENEGDLYVAVMDINGTPYDTSDDTEIARFRNNLHAENGFLNQYKADLSDFIGTNAYLNIVDSGTTNWGWFAMDSFVTYYADETTIPEGADEALNYEVGDTTAPTVTTSEATIEVHTPSGDINWNDYITVTDDYDANPAIVTDATNVDLTTLGDYTVDVTVTDDAGNEATDTITVHVVDTTDPEVTVEPVIYLMINTSDVDWEAYMTTTDNLDDEPTIDVDTSSVDLTTLGSYTLTYTVTDAEGNETVADTTVEVVDTDLPPVLKGTHDIVIKVGSDEPDWLEGVTANDVPDADITDSIEVLNTDSVDLTTVGTYTITYSVTDSADQTTTEDVSVIVYETNTIENGDFETGDYTGWTATGDAFGTGEIKNDDAYWVDGEFFGKDGDYFYLGNGVEDKKGELSSSSFTLAGSGWITFKIGGGKPDRNIDNDGEVYVAIMDTKGTADTSDDEEIARFLNTKHAENGHMFLYKADLTDHLGKDLSIKVVDDATTNWGWFAMDSFNTYYANESDLPADAVVAVEDYEAPTFTLTETTVDVEVGTASVDFTQYVTDKADNFDPKPNDDNDPQLQLIVDTINLDLNTVGTQTVSLTVRDIFGNATTKTIVVNVLDTTAPEGTVSTVEYMTGSTIDWNSLITVTDNSSVDPTVTVDTTNLDLNTPGTYTVTYTITDASGNNATVDMTVNIVNDPAPVLEGINNDLLELRLGTTEPVWLDGVTATDMPDGDLTSSIVLTEDVDMNTVGNYTVSYKVVDSYGNETIKVVTVIVYDEIINGDFETGDFTGWISTGTAFTQVTSEWQNYYNNWTGPEPDVGYWYNAWKQGDALDNHDTYGEAATGTLQSSTFTLSGTGDITFRIGGAKNMDLLYISVYKEDGTEIARYGNELFDGTEGANLETQLYRYKANLSQYVGEKLYIKVVDNATTDWGHIFMDSFVTYYRDDTELPSDTVDATNLLTVL